MTPEETAPVSEGSGGAESERRLDDVLLASELMALEKRYDEAEDLLRDLAQRFPDSPLPHHNLAVVSLMRLRDNYEHLEVWEDLANDEVHFEAAVAEAEAAVDADPNFTPAYNILGTLFALRGWWDDAVRHWETSLAIHPEQPDLREDLLLARKRLGE